MTPIANAIAQLGGPTAAGRLFDIVYQTPQQWIAQGRVPAEYCPRIEQLTGIRCEELNDRVDWSLIRGADHAAELRGAIAQTRLVFEGHRDAQDALEYLELVLASNIAKSIAATLTEMKDAMPTAASVPPRDNSALAQIKRELFTTSDQLQQPADLVVQLLVLAELRGMRAEQASDRFAHGAAVLS